MLGGRVSMRPTCGCCSCSSAASSMVTRRSLSEMKADNALSIVVLPEPVPPEMIVVTRARTAAARTSAIGGRSAPMSTSFCRLNGFLENLRIETSGPSTPIGRTAMLMREPSSRRASHKGCVSSTRRPTAETILLMMRRRCGFVLEPHQRRFEHAGPLDVDAFVAVDQNVVDGRVLEQRLDRSETGHFIEDLV